MNEIKDNLCNIGAVRTAKQAPTLALIRVAGYLQAGAYVLEERCRRNGGVLWSMQSLKPRR